MRIMAARARFLGIVLAALCTLPLGAAHGDTRTDFLGRLLKSSTQFRVRAQAAISLGRVTGDASVVRTLVSALNDEHPAVRAAAASSLERLGDPSALAALRTRAADSRENSEVRAAAASAVTVLASARVTSAQPEATAPPTTAIVEPPDEQGTATFYVGVGVPGSRVAGLDEALLKGAQDFLRGRVQAVSGVVLAPDGEKPRQAETVMRTRRLTGYFIDSSIVSVEQRPDGGVRASVSVIVGTYPGRDMRSILQGAATVMGGGTTARSQAIEAAFTGALRNLGQAMAAGRR